MVLADSPRISRVPGYSGARYISNFVSNTGLSPSTVILSNMFFYKVKDDVASPTTPFTY